MNALVDNRYTIETPEGVAFAVDLAGPVPRIWAAVIDLCVRGVVHLGLLIALALFEQLGMGIYLICAFLLEWAYPIYFEMYHQGQTPGKKLFDLQVLNADATPVSWKGSVLRNLLRVADFLPAGYLLGVATMAGTRRFQRLGDLAGDTVVCYRTDHRLTGFDDLPDAPPVTVSRQLSLEEQAAIVAFAERSRRWSPARNAELAKILEPLTGNRSGSRAVEFLRGLANRIVKWA